MRHEREETDITELAGHSHSNCRWMDRKYTRFSYWSV